MKLLKFITVFLLAIFVLPSFAESTPKDDATPTAETWYVTYELPGVQICSGTWLQITTSQDKNLKLFNGTISCDTGVGLDYKIAVRNTSSNAISGFRQDYPGQIYNGIYFDANTIKGTFKKGPYTYTWTARIAQK